MFISQALAAAPAVADAAAAGAPSPWEAFALNMLLIVILVVMFYVLLIMPQQSRLKKHREMINKLRKGDKIITYGGFVGVIDKVKDDEGEVVLDFGNGVKITALRSAIQNRADDRPAAKTKDGKKDDAKKEDSKKEDENKAA